eukprot:TRINITY_DN3427_c0_g1_i5.p2 TRINITY_DN3427_c0_g1~~TRINITY_DN3427_c0_g1_i5.p2  ORF type:complete len:273 (+),score=93.10 TRINITY_DN3427_c0_g1_i5:3-821(+)
MDEKKVETNKHGNDKTERQDEKASPAIASKGIKSQETGSPSSPYAIDLFDGFESKKKKSGKKGQGKTKTPERTPVGKKGIAWGDNRSSSQIPETPLSEYSRWDYEPDELGVRNQVTPKGEDMVDAFSHVLNSGPMKNLLRADVRMKLVERIEDANDDGDAQQPRANEDQKIEALWTESPFKPREKTMKALENRLKGVESRYMEGVGTGPGAGRTMPEDSEEEVESEIVMEDWEMDVGVSNGTGKTSNTKKKKKKKKRSPGKKKRKTHQRHQK